MSQISDRDYWSTCRALGLGVVSRITITTSKYVSAYCTVQYVYNRTTVINSQVTSAEYISKRICRAYSAPVDVNLYVSAYFTACVVTAKNSSYSTSSNGKFNVIGYVSLVGTSIYSIYTLRSTTCASNGNDSCITCSKVTASIELSYMQIARVVTLFNCYAISTANSSIGV